MATIKDVARLAGVSTTTVSHVVNHTRFVADATTQKVKEAIEALSYAPSAAARSLKCNTTKTIGMLVTKSTNPFFAEVVHGVEADCYANGYTLILCNTEGDLTKQQDYLRMLAEKRVDGLLVMCSDLNDRLLDLLDRYHKVPMVVMDWAPNNHTKDRLQDNAEEGGYLATRYLIEQGHQKIGCLSGQKDKYTCAQRLHGFRRAMAESNLAVNEDWLLTGDFECESAVQAAKTTLNMTERPTAMFCFNDIMAMAFISTLTQHGLSIPEDMSVIGYDNIELANYFSPPLTTVHQPKRRLGEQAITILLERMKNESSAPMTFEMHPEMVIRHSVMPPKK